MIEENTVLHNCREYLEYYIYDYVASGYGDIGSETYYKCRVCGKRFETKEIEE